MSTSNNTKQKSENNLPQHLTDLNDAQYEAVTCLDGPLIIFAGAGSGKTRVLTRRIAHLIYTQKAFPSQILAVTFTNKAATEMKERVAGLFSQNIGSFWVSTFHSACLRILRINAEVLGLTGNFTVYDKNDSLSVIKRILDDKKIDKDIFTPKHVQHVIDKAKNDFLNEEEFLRYNSFDDAQLLLEIYQQYQDELKKANAMDFGDLISKTIELFRDNKNILEIYQNKFKYIMVDEYQDTNHSQYLLIKMLAAKHKNLCVVGDDDQSIYAFRGANIGNILNFKHDYPDCTEITLNVNYRSTKTILNAASEIIAKNIYRKKKNITTFNEDGEPIYYFCADTDRSEAEFVASEILRLKRQGLKLSDIAVFYRTNSQSRVIEEMLLSHGIEYIIYGGFKFYERKEIKDILAYCRLLINPNDDSAFLRIINTPARGIGNVTIASLKTLAQKHELSLFALTKKLLTENSKILTSATRKKLEPFYNTIQELIVDTEKVQEDLHNVNIPVKQRGFLLSSLIRTIADKSGYLKKLTEEKTEEANNKKDNIEELMRVSEEFINNNSEEDVVTLTDFLDRSCLSSGLDTENADESNNIPAQLKEINHNKVSLMTLHLAKGLEFEAVFFVGLEEGLLPHSRSETEDDIEEERRLCYVGVTRAKKKLYLSQAMVRRLFDGKSPWSARETSRFIVNLPPELLYVITS